jgi:hypothetical protein
MIQKRFVQRPAMITSTYADDFTLGAMTSELTKAPWSNQRVSMAVRVGAGFFVFCGVGAIVSVTFILLSDRLRSEHLWLAVTTLPASFYLLWLFGHAAVKGKAPEGWFPSWRRQRDT